MANPFVYSTPIPPEEFKNRSKVINLVCERLDQSGRPSACIIGGPSTGRTSLLRYLASPYAAERYPGLKSSWNVYIDGGALGSTATPFDFWHRCFREIDHQVDTGGLKATVGGLVSKASNETIDSYDLEDFFDSCANNHTPVVLFINDFEVLLKNKNFWPPNDFFHIVRSLGQKIPRGLSFLVGTPRPISELWDSTAGASPFYNIFTTWTVGRLEEEEIRQHVQEGFQILGLQSNSDIEDLIIKASERHPKLVNYVSYLCSEMLLTGGPIKVERIYEAFNEPDGLFVILHRRIFENITSTEQDWCKRARANPNEPSPEQLQRLRKLWDYGLIPPGTLFR